MGNSMIGCLGLVELAAIDVANVLVFAIGVSVTAYAVYTAARFAKWMRTSDLSVVLVACVANDIVDNVCTLVFASNACANVLFDAQGNPNSINQWLAVMLRMLIFCCGHLVIVLVASRAAKDQARRDELAGRIMDCIDA